MWDAPAPLAPAAAAVAVAVRGGSTAAFRRLGVLRGPGRACRMLRRRSRQRPRRRRVPGGHGGAGRARHHRGRVKYAVVFEAAGTTGGGGKGTDGGAGRVCGGPADMGCPTTALRCRSSARTRHGGHATAAAGLRPCLVIGRDGGAPQETPGPRAKLVVAPTASAAMEAVEEQAGQGLAEAGDQERGEGPTSG